MQIYNKSRLYLILFVGVFCLLCGTLAVRTLLSGDSRSQNNSLILLQNTVESDLPIEQNQPPAQGDTSQVLQAGAAVSFGADHAPAGMVVLGAADPNTEDPETGYKFQVQLTTQGAAVRKVVFSNGNNHGFDNRNVKDLKPLEIISPVVQSNGGEILSMANKELVLVDYQQQLQLQNLQWQRIETDNPQIARFETIVKIQETGEPVLKLIKTYSIFPDSYLLDCKITVENLSDSDKKIRLNLSGLGGVPREGYRADMRKTVAGFRETNGSISSVRLDIKKLEKAKTVEDMLLEKAGSQFLWAAAVNKYFAVITVPMPETGKDYCDWIQTKRGHSYNPDGDAKYDSGDETIGIDLSVVPMTLTAAGQSGSSRDYDFQLYIGPKDKSLFDKNQRYRALGFVQTIDFMSCCCPASIINPLAFAVLAIMKWMYGFIHNYGIVIIILVFLMRLAMHPITKKSQVSMSKMSKLAPRAEEIKKKYANNKAEMNKQMMALYKEQGASPIMGFLPMFIQMPIWIALWSAVYTSIDLRGAGFLPFWITDLSAPDAFFRFPAVTLPLFGKLDSFNLLPILMGVAFYLQQKLMPGQPNASTNPQVAQQQKMMKIMMTVLFPLMLYKGPSGVNLYIMSSTFAGVIEQYVIRKHIKEKEEEEAKGLVSVTSKTGGKVKKKKPKPFFKTK